MRQFYTIASNAFMELVRQPVFLLLMTCSAVFCVFLSSIPYIALGDDPKLVKDSVLAVMLLTGLFGAVFTASSSVAREIRSGTALAVLAKPVSRIQFILAKYTGLAAALTLLTYVVMLAALLASRMAYDAYGETDVAGTAVYAGAVALAYIIAAFGNYFLRRTFVADAVFSLSITTTLAYFIIVKFMHLTRPFGEVAAVDLRMVPASILILFALWILAGLALACSTRFDTIPTLAICSSIFLLGLMSDYLFGQAAQAGRWWGHVLYSAVPNWQLFWLADTLEEGKPGVPWTYVFKALGYVVGYLGASLCAALLLFEDRELS